jgi:hypothetical protein
VFPIVAVWIAFKQTIPNEITYSPGQETGGSIIRSLCFLLLFTIPAVTFEIQLSFRHIEALFPLYPFDQLSNEGILKFDDSAAPLADEMLVLLRLLNLVIAANLAQPHLVNQAQFLEELKAAVHCRWANRLIPGTGAAVKLLGVDMPRSIS